MMSSRKRQKREGNNQSKWVEGAFAFVEKRPRSASMRRRSATGEKRRWETKRSPRSSMEREPKKAESEMP